MFLFFHRAGLTDGLRFSYAVRRILVHGRGLRSKAEQLALARRLQTRRQRPVADRHRIIIALSDRAEAAALAAWLADDGFEPALRPTPPMAIEEMRARPFDLLIADASRDGRVAMQPEGQARRALTPAILIGNATAGRDKGVTNRPIFVTRPVDRAHLKCYVAMALLEGSPIRCSERRLVLPFEAIINGVPSHIIDVSVEGLRIRTPPDHTGVLPPQFVVSVPLMGVSINVRRVWTRSSSGPALGLYYGVSLLPNRSSAIQGWRSLIETIPGAIDAHDSY